MPASGRFGCVGDMEGRRLAHEQPTLLTTKPQVMHRAAFAEYAVRTVLAMDHRVLTSMSTTSTLMYAHLQRDVHIELRQLRPIQNLV